MPLSGALLFALCAFTVQLVGGSKLVVPLSEEADGGNLEH